MKLITVADLQQLIARVGVDEFLRLAIEALEADFRRWPALQKSPRHAFHYPFGVMELMPCADDAFYGAKYVNGHPRNTATGKLSVVALGLLADVPTGYPLLLSEMTLLTAVRTAATAALAARYLAEPKTRHIALIGTGAQAEFEVLTLQAVLPVDCVSYYDSDPEAMAKFAAHMQDRLALRPCRSIAEATAEATLWVTATAAKQRQQLITEDMLRPGLHINALGGDCPGKTELQAQVLDHCKIVVEYAEQSLLEGEIQQGRADQLYGELWELVSGRKPGRERAEEITLYDAVGIGLEDFAMLKLVYRLAEETGIGSDIAMVPSLGNPKDLFSLLA